MNPFSTSLASNERSRLHRAPSLTRDPLAERLLDGVDGAIAGAVLLLPWCMGGRHPIGELLLVVLSIGAALAWLAHQYVTTGRLTWTRSHADWIFLAALAIALMQLVPLPHGLFDLLSPHSKTMLPLWRGGEASLGLWNQVSMTPVGTRGSLVVLLAYGLFFFTTFARVQRLEDVERLLRCVALSAVVTAAFGLLQYLTSNGKFLWFYEHPYRDTLYVAKGMYINQNHFAHFLALAIGPLVWCLQNSLQEPRTELELLARRVRPGQKAVVGISLAVVLFAALMSLSRGGIAAIGLAALVCGSALYLRGLLDKRFVLCAAAVVGLLGVSLLVHGRHRVTERLDDYTSGSMADLDTNGGRRLIWQTDLAAFQDYFVLGSGVGSHREIYPAYMKQSWDTEFTHAENGYLQVALETGLPGVILLLVALGLLATCCVRTLRQTRSNRLFACVAAISASLAASAAHSLADFPWYIPSCMAVTLLLAACGLRLALLHRSQSEPAAWSLPRPCIVAAGIAVALAGCGMTYDRFCASMAAPHWDAYLRFALTTEARQGRAQPTPEVIDHLRRIVGWTPGDSRAHLRLAGACLRRFEVVQATSNNAMPLNQIRDAAIASKFPSRATLDDWLARAVGDNRRLLDAAAWHTGRALASCPLEGEAYTYLAQLGFLNGPAQLATPALVDQAVRVRPASGGVLLFAGSDAALSGDLKRALDYWQRAFRTGRDTQSELIDLWANAQMPLGLMLEWFEPDLAAVRMLDQRYSKLPPSEQTNQLLHYYAQVGQSTATRLEPGQAAPIWLELHEVFRRLGNDRAELEALSRAAALAPNDYAVRQSLGTVLCRQCRFAEAEPHLRWCVERRPRDQQMAQLLSTAVKGRVEVVSDEVRTNFRSVETRR